MRTTAAYLSLGFLLISCSSPSDKFAVEVDQLCECMKKSGYDPKDKADLKMTLGVCLLDAKVDLKDDQMVVELEKKCPEIVEGFEEFIDGL